MKVKLNFNYNEEYLPTKRHRIPRIREVEDSIDVNIIELTKQDVELAFTVKDYGNDQKGNFRKLNIPYYAYDNCFFIKSLASRYTCNAKGFMTKTKLKFHLKDIAERVYIYGKKRTCNAVVDEINNEVSRFIIINDNVYERIGEPMYCIYTFGLGHNHGGSSLSIENHYNSNISKDRYFNSLERKEALKEFKKIALGRGDTESVRGNKASYTVHDIIVHNEKFVSRNPQQEHGDGCEFINSIENIVENSNSPIEAGMYI